ncbi:MAG: biotin-dependent carboxyltransferase family protein [Cyclobacteriaceae bacterium]|nr:biotin-dependent carboxyltransferase family protein [Cyclobacteriaceae bacterium]
MSVSIVRSGLLDVVQDGGRWGHQHEGINPGGAMDVVAMEVANALTGNAPSEAVIEMCFPAATLRFNQSACIALSGADFGALANGKPVPVHHTIMVPANTELTFAKNVRGAFAYLSVRGGFAIASWLGSKSTNLKAKAGAFGRALRAGDNLTFNAPQPEVSDMQIFPWSVANDFYYGTEIRCITGPEFDWLDEASWDAIVTSSFKLTSLSDRMGYRFESGPLKKNTTDELLSSAVMRGTVQLLPSGQIICLMADHQTTGGYPRILQVIGVDLPKLAQRRAHESVTFRLISLEEAEALWMEHCRLMGQIQSACRLKLKTILG